jgi:hypothetical protein
MEIVIDRKLSRWSDAVDVLGRGKHVRRNGGVRRHARSGLV